ncbi:MAG: sporulation protein YunB [Oscillospiraceae bacterium]|nr:sporulation protein YunB [Oscillospiraceae bacterium]MBR6208086.1 sporulation protein YunB [Oscillospiraceae bacterium]
MPGRKPFFRRAGVSLIPALLALLLSIILFLIPASRYFRALTGAMAENCASDVIARRVNAVVEKKMEEWGQTPREYVHLEKDASGAVTAIMTDTAQVNILCSELLHAIIDACNEGELTVRIPLGDLLGVGLFLGKGFRVPMRITMLTSSHVGYENVLTDAGINQTKHQLLLVVEANASVLLPWETRTAHVENQVLVAETVVIGQVPGTYVRLGE